MLSPLKWVVMLAPLAFILFFSFKAESMSSSTARAMFFAFAAVMGLSMSSIFLVFTGESIARVFFITAATFGGLSLAGYTTKKSLSGMGSFLIMGLIGLVIASVVNIFLASSALGFAISVDRRAGLRRPDRLGYPASEGDVSLFRPGSRNRLRSFR